MYTTSDRDLPVCLAAVPGFHEMQLDPSDAAQDQPIAATEPVLPGGEVGHQVRAVIERVGVEHAGLQPVARALAMSPRTLERRLAQQGTTFNGLLDAYRRDRAWWLLRHTDFCVDRIALELGFCGAKNFARTFRRWYGDTPSRSRKTALLY